LTGDTLAVAFRGAPAALQLIGPGGRVLATTLASDSTRWVIPCDAAWVRIVAHTRTTQLFLEPLIRTETGALPPVAATVAPIPTYAHRAMAGVLVLIAAMAWVGAFAGRRGSGEPASVDGALRSAA
jgi:hypothetical protein